MKLINKLSFAAILFLLFNPQFYGQYNEYSHQRELTEITDQWHRFELPNDMFDNVSQNLSDVRIYGFNGLNDTLEVPFILTLQKDITQHRNIDFKTINQSHNQSGYYYTFEITTAESINRIELNFAGSNYDWKTNLEGSQDQEEWFTIVEDQRIISIRNEETNFKINDISFPDTKYQYFRLLIKTDQDPNFKRANISLEDIFSGNYRDFDASFTQTTHNVKDNLTEIEINLLEKVPVNQINVSVLDTIDYFRNITIKYLSDSIKTENGWIYRYENLTSGTLNSLKDNVFSFKSTILDKIKIIIHNQDNEPLTLGDHQIKGNVYQIEARFPPASEFYMVYGKNHDRKPQYDIGQFSARIPQSMSSIIVGKEQIISKEIVENESPLFKNKIWLWAIIIIAILLLGWFSIKMIQNK